MLVLRAGRVAALGTWEELLALDLPELRTFEPITPTVSTPPPSQPVHASKAVTNPAVSLAATHDDPVLIDEGLPDNNGTRQQLDATSLASVKVAGAASEGVVPSDSAGSSTSCDSPVLRLGKGSFPESGKDCKSGVFRVLVFSLLLGCGLLRLLLRYSSRFSLGHCSQMSGCL